MVNESPSNPSIFQGENSKKKKKKKKKRGLFPSEKTMLSM